MDRRRFLGSVIGLVAGAPFIADFAPLTVQRSSTVKEWCAACKAAVVLKGGERFWSPDLSLTYGQNGESATWIAKPISITETLTVLGVEMYGPDGNIWMRRHFDGTVLVCKGDTLTVRYTLSTDDPMWLDFDLDELRSHIATKIPVEPLSPYWS